MLQYWKIIALRVAGILKEYPNLKLTHGRKVLEVRPVIDWNKGKAVEFLLDSLGEYLILNLLLLGLYYGYMSLRVLFNRNLLVMRVLVCLLPHLPRLCIWRDLLE